ncbi:hypothetical protein LOC51_27605 [Rubrivivax sp. JA1024]|nr:hypothetical protein [Rubrivivax sp. JA1024]
MAIISSPSAPWALLQRAAALRGSALDTVVQIGADGTTLDDCAAAAIGKLSIVEGDESMARALRAAAATCERRIDVLETVVAARDGAVLWHAYKLPAYSGPRARDGLRTWFPRLGEARVTERAARALGAVLAELNPEPCAEGKALLIDLPGQEPGLLAAVPDEVLQRFEWIAARGWNRPPIGEAGHGDCARRLKAAGFVLQETSSRDDFATAVWLYRFDGLRLQHERNAAELARLRAYEAGEQQRELQLGALQTALDAARLEIEELSKRVGTLAAERDAAQARAAELEARAQDNEARLARFVGELERAEAQLDAIRGFILDSSTP